jgi:hypothetical protein
LALAFLAATGLAGWTTPVEAQALLMTDTVPSVQPEVLDLSIEKYCCTAAQLTGLRSLFPVAQAQSPQQAARRSRAAKITKLVVGGHHDWSRELSDANR